MNAVKEIKDEDIFECTMCKQVKLNHEFMHRHFKNSNVTRDQWCRVCRLDIMKKARETAAEERRRIKAEKKANRAKNISKAVKKAWAKRKQKKAQFVTPPPAPQKELSMEIETVARKALPPVFTTGNAGWICPTCDYVWAPHVAGCPKCNNK